MNDETLFNVRRSLVTARISAVKAGLDILINDLDAHYLNRWKMMRESRRQHDSPIPSSAAGRMPSVCMDS